MVKKNLSLSLLTFITWWLMAVPASANIFSTNPFAASDDGPVEVSEAFDLMVSQAEGGQVNLDWTLRDGYYLYRDRMTIAVDPALALVSTTKSTAKEKDDPLFGRVHVYYHQAQAQLSVASAADAVADGMLTVTYQGCWEGGVCYPPVTETFPLKELPPESGLIAIAAQDTASVTPSPDEAQIPLSEQDRFAGMLRDSSLLLTLGAFFVAGLALSFTPCVFPMIPILSSIIAGQGGQMTAARGLRYSLVYVLSVAVTYTLIGIIAGLFGANLQIAFQMPWIIGLFSAIFVLLAFAMFGFYDLQLPASWQTRLSQLSNSQQGGSLIGVGIMGLLSALIVGPCMAAPLAGALIYIGQTGDPVLGGLALFSLSMGMGVPLLIVGASAGRLLPKAGGWMDGVKAFFGVMMLAMAVWMLDRILPVAVTMLLAAALLIISAVYMGALDRLKETASGWHKLWKGAGVLCLVYGVVLAIGVFAGSQSFLRPLQGLVAGGAEVKQAGLPFNVVTQPDQLDNLLAQAEQAGKPVMLDFYADWCISCVELEEFTLKDDAVMQSLDDFMLIKVDVTANDEGARTLYKRYELIGPPALIFYDRSGQLIRKMTLVGVVKPDALVSHIARL